MALVSTASRSGGSSSGVVAFGSQAADVSTAGTTYGTGADVLSAAISFTADGTSSYAVVLIAPAATNTSTTGNNNLAVTLDGAQSSFMSFITPSVAVNEASSCTASGIIVPASGGRTVNVKLFVSSGTGKILSGTSLTNAKILVYVQKLG